MPISPRPALRLLSVRLSLSVLASLALAACDTTTSPAPKPPATNTRTGSSTGPSRAGATANTRHTAASSATGSATAAGTTAGTTGAARKTPWDPLTHTPPGPGWREAKAEEVDRAIKILEQQARRGATEAGNGWAMAHGLVGFGKALKMADGSPVLDHIVSDFAVREKRGGRTVWSFPAEKNGKPVEPHPHLLLKAVVESGVPLTHTFTIREGGKGAKAARVTLDQLIKDAAWRHEQPTNAHAWQESAWWTATMLEARAAHGTYRVTTQHGPVALMTWLEQSLTELEKDHAFLEPLYRAGRPDQFRKERQSIYEHACGGTHALQSVLRGAALATGPKRDTIRARALHQLELLLFRWDAERRGYRHLVATNRELRMMVLVQEAKFYGHVIETLARAHAWGLWPANARNRKIMHRVIGDYLNSLNNLAPLYLGQDRIRAASAQTYLDLIGDACHALRGLKAARASFYT